MTTKLSSTVSRRAVARPPLRPDMTVRQIAADYPGCREVFLRHGEPDKRAGKFGHLEPLDCFAHRIDVPLEQLLCELAEAAGVDVDVDAAAGELVHRPFIVAALAITLSLGAGWGALLLLEIGLRGDFAAVPTAHVVAHGEAQLWGFIALFVMGIAVRYLPVTTSMPRPSLRLCRLLLAMALAGIAGGFVWALVSARVSWLGPASGCATVLAAAGFLIVVVRQLTAKLGATWARFVLAAAIWLVIWSCTTVVLRIGAATDGPASYSPAVRLLLIKLAVFGFAMNAIYGFGQKLLAGFLGSGSARSSAIEAAFWTHNLAVLLLVTAGLQTVVLLDAGGSAALTAAAVCYAVGLRGFRRGRRVSARPEQGAAFTARYIQLAFFWLLCGLALLVLGELYPLLSAAGTSLSHAYFGAVRHALTVGFMTTLILGVGQRLLPILGHTRLAWPQLVGPIWVLIAVGNLLRVGSEMATMAFPPAFRIMPFSAVLELAALGLFTTNVLRTFWPPPDPLLRTGQATSLTPVKLLLAEYAALEDELIAAGFAYLGRTRSVPAELTLGSLAASEGHDVQETVRLVNNLLPIKRGGPIA